MTRKYWKLGSLATVAMALAVTGPACSDDDETTPTAGTGGSGTGGTGGTGGGTGGEAPEWPPTDVTEKIRPDHPRMFLTADTLPEVNTMAEGPAASHFERVVSAADTYDWTSDPENWGSEVLNTALVYLVTGAAGYLDKAKDGLLQSLDHYDARLGAGQAVSWYSSSRICALAAYDWLYNDLSPAERSEIIGRLMSHVHDVQPDGTARCWGRNGYGQLGDGTNSDSTVLAGVQSF